MPKLSTRLDWPTANQNYLMAHLAQVRSHLERHAQETSDTDDTSLLIQKAHQALPSASALDSLTERFKLTDFEQGVLLLCAGMEFDATFSALCASAQGDPQRSYPTYSLALAALPNPHWSALTSQSPLRRWQLLELTPGRALTTSPLKIDERILHYLAGVSHQDEQLAPLVHLLAPTVALIPSHQKLVEQITRTWSQSALPVLQLVGQDSASRQGLATAAGQALGLQVYRLNASYLPTLPAEFHQFCLAWEREALLVGCALFIEADLREDRIPLLIRLLETVKAPLFLSSPDRQPPLPTRPLLTYDLAPPTVAEQRDLWQTALGDGHTDLNSTVDHLVAHFTLSPLAIQTACSAVVGASDLATSLWETCLHQARPQLEDLAQRIEGSAAWEDLVLPEAQKQILRDVSAHVRQRGQVYEQWGFAKKGSRGLGISALFAGASGTGKTMAAEVLAASLKLDLYRIDLSAVVSKYIGETEKNLRRVFDAAETGGAVLLFDEADALFGKRSEVKDSHDRHANIEVSYLLQRMEAYRGLAILTTNLKDSLDSAFLRRIRFMVRFPFPDVHQRAEIWQRIFPSHTPTLGLDMQKLARLNVAGGNIRNIALNSAFLAADKGEPVQMKHVLTAAKSEYAKLEKPLTDAEVRGWV